MASESLPNNFPLLDSLQLYPTPDAPGALLEDTVGKRFFRLGPRESQFVEQLQTTRSAQLAWERCCASPQPSLTKDATARLCRWLIANKLVQMSTTQALPVTNVNLLSRAFFLKVPLFNPDALLRIVVQKAGLLFSWWAVIVCLAILALGMFTVAGRWNEFGYSYENLFSPWQGLTLAIGWCALKFIHELAHAGTCRRYGGEVIEAGIAFILLMPLAYVNATSSWRFPSRWQRLHVTLAGVIAELGVAGLALIVFSSTSSPIWQQVAANVFLLASVNSLLFNLNPLLRFDGYFALADATGVDNLYNYGQQYARYFGGRFFLGLDMRPPALPLGHASWIKVYGCAAAVYRTMTVTGLLIAAAALLEGAGLVIALGGVVAFVVKPLSILVVYLAKSHAAGRLSMSRFVVRVGGLIAVCVAPWWFIPAGVCWTVPAIVQYDPPAVMRARSDAFVDQIHVCNGQFVTKGQPVVTLRNDDLVIELGRKKTELAQTQCKLSTARWLGRSSETKAAQSRCDSLKEQVEQLQREVDQLRLVAPVDGIVVARRLALLHGTYVESGAEIAVVGREESKRLKVSITQNDATYLEKYEAPPARVLVGNLAWEATIDRIETRADTTPIDDSLLAINGGSLASIQGDNSDVRVVTPRVSAFIRLTPEQSLALRPGRRASVALGGARETLGKQLLFRLREFLAL